jgi:hypothetical protein
MEKEVRTKRGFRAVKRLAQALAGVLCGVAILVGIAYWYESDWDIDPRRERIEAEAVALGPAHPWAGTYYRGGLGCIELLTLAPDEGYQYTDHGCLGLYRADHGWVALSAGHLVLRASMLCCPPLQRREFVVVDLGPRRYLVEPDQLIEFANDVNTGREDPNQYFRRGCSIYLRAGDEERAFSGQSVHPEQVARLILRSAIDGHVTACRSEQGRALDATGGGVFDVEIDLGRVSGTFEGMKLMFHEQAGDAYGSMIVTRVAERSSSGRSDKYSFGHPPAPGWTVTSR